MKPYELRALPMAMPKPVSHHMREPMRASRRFLMRALLVFLRLTW